MSKFEKWLKEKLKEYRSLSKSFDHNPDRGYWNIRANTVQEILDHYQSPEAKPPAIEIALEMLNHHIPGYPHSEEFAKRLVEALALEVVSAAVDKLVDVEAEPEIITLRDKLLELSKVKRDRAKAMEDSPSEILSKCKLEGEQRGYYDAYCLADQIVTDSAAKAREALMAGVAQYFDGAE